MTMKKTNNLRNNGSQGTGTVVLSLNKSAGGNVDVTVENSTNSGKVSFGDPFGFKFLTRNSNSIIRG